MYKSRVAILFFLLFFVALLTGAGSTQPASSDANILLAWKVSLEDRSGVLEGWNTSFNVCTWQFIKCDKDRRVIELNLMSLNLTGLVTQHLSQLDRLQVLALNDNAFKGNLPKELSQLKQLRVLTLSGNQFNGSIPSELSQLKKLEKMELSYNPFSGSIPTDFGSLTSLTYLRLVSNSLTGSIPASLGNLSKLSYLDFTGNNFFGGIPSEFSRLSSLQALILANNNLSGPIQRELFLGKPCSLSLIDLSFNAFVGSLPESLINCAQLSSVAVQNNSLSGSLPTKLHRLPLLQEIDLSSNNFTGTLPEELSQCSKLCRFKISNNRIHGPIPSLPNLCSQDEPYLFISFEADNNLLSGPIPAFFSNLGSRLDTLDLHHNNLSGTIPAQLASTALKYLYLSNNQLTGHIPDSLTNMSQLINLDLSFNKFSGPLPAGIGNLQSLQVLLINNNLIEGSIPEGVGNLTQLTTFNASNNWLEGMIPANISNLYKNLARVDVSSNNLSGALPQGLSALTQLQVLDLSNNHFTGNLPVFGLSSTVQELLLANNSFSGSLPTSLMRLQFLIKLDAINNSLSGQLPTEWGGLHAILEAVLLSGNGFEGTIPASLGKLQFLQELALARNRLEGTIPDSLTLLTRLRSLELDQNFLEGFIPPGLAALPLRTFNVSGNKLYGSVPAGNLSAFPKSAFEGNNLCGKPLAACKHGGGLAVGAIGGIAAASVGAVVVLASALLFWVSRHREPNDAEELDFSEGELVVYEELGFNFTMQDLYNATDNFHPSTVLGQGGFGSVYKATLEDGKIHLAIKRLAQDSRQGEKEFLAEMNTLGKIRHRNLVKLLAVYSDPVARERLLIYNFLPGGSVDSRLFNTSEVDIRLRQWPCRWNIAVGTARGLKYLHSSCMPRIIHRDIKPANVLLDLDLEAYVADFGLARLWDNEGSHISTKLFGTIGYMAPEYAQRGRLTDKTDVYAYGIFLLQLITGRKPSDQEVAEMGLPGWTHAQEFLTVVDSTLIFQGSKERAQVMAALKLGQLCTARQEGERPTMAEALHSLEHLDDFAAQILLYNLPSPFDSDWHSNPADSD